jgi:hypothetical protein
MTAGISRITVVAGTIAGTIATIARMAVATIAAVAAVTTVTTLIVDIAGLMLLTLHRELIGDIVEELLDLHGGGGVVVVV